MDSIPVQRPSIRCTDVEALYASSQCCQRLPFLYGNFSREFLHIEMKYQSLPQLPLQVLHFSFESGYPSFLFLPNVRVKEIAREGR